MSQPDRPEPAFLPPPALPDIRVRPDGSMEGIDGLLDQIAGALSRRLGPMIKQEILPVLQEDRELQERIGQGIGREVALPLWAVALGIGIYTFLKWQKYENRLVKKVVR